MPTVNATIERITSTISSTCFLIKKEDGVVINRKWQLDEYKGTNLRPPIINI